MSVLNYVPLFLCPKAKKNQFDEVCVKIVKAIEKRNWKVPGLTIKFSVYGSGESKYCYIKNIYGDDFKLDFCKVEDELEGYNDKSVLFQVTIPFQQMRVYGDESLPTYYLYVGKDWNKDKKEFIHNIKAIAKLIGKPKTYLKYEGKKCDGSNQLLVNTNDLGREYSPEGNEHTEFVLDEKFKEFTDWLYKNVLEYILSFPEAEVINPPVIPNKLIPYKGMWDIIFSISNEPFKKRIEIGKKNLEELEPEDRHASLHSYRCLIYFSLGGNDKETPKVAFGEYIWCDTNQDITSKSSYNSLNFEIRNGYFRGWDKKLIVAISLKYANDVYVIDNAPFDETRKQIFESIAPRNTLTDEELTKAYVARGKTIIPINEYKGGYKEPLVLIRRELDFNEIAWVQEKEIK